MRIQGDFSGQCLAYNRVHCVNRSIALRSMLALSGVHVQYFFLSPLLCIWCWCTAYWHLVYMLLSNFHLMTFSKRRIVLIQSVCALVLAFVIEAQTP